MSHHQEKTATNKSDPMQVLLMEDDTSVAKGLQMILTEEGYSVDVAITGKNAMDTADHKRFDLLVADLRLPDMDGMEVVRRVKEMRPETEVIVITGYANVHTAVDAMKTGAIDYLSKPFTEEIFMARVEEAMGRRRACTDDALQTKPEEMPEAPVQEAGPKVLVIEDEPSVAKGLMLILREQGFETSIAENGQAGIDMTADTDFDLLVVDLRLPDMDGMNVIRHARAQFPDTPVIVITGYASVGSAVEALRMGVADFLSKPFTEEAFLTTVGKALKERPNSQNGSHFLRQTAEMAATVRIGFYICHGGTDISKAINIADIVRFAGRQPGVAIARDQQYLCRDTGLAQIKKDIEERGLNRVVVAACAPDAYEKIFKDACGQAGLKPDHFQMVPVREQVSWVAGSPAEALTKTRTLIAAAIHRVKYHNIIPPRRVPVHPDVLIVGGGIAGMQAALDIGRSGNRVHLVEKSSTIGGHMLQFDKTFPTLDCAACIGTPVMVDVAQNPNIHLMTLSEVVDIRGHIGNYTITVRRNPRYVDETLCTGCGECEKVCPVSRPSEWDEGLKQRKAIYRSFPQAVPIAYAIDKRGTAPCKATCPAHVSIQGYIALMNQGRLAEALALFRRDHPFPGVCGRVCHHPCESECTRKDVDDPLAIRDLHRFLFDWETSRNETFLPETAAEKKDEKIAIIGSGPAGLSAGYFLAKKGYRPTIFEKLPVAGGWMAVGIPEYRLPRNILAREIDIIRHLGVEIKTGVTFGRDITFNSLQAEGFAAIFMGIGLQSGRRLGIEGEDAQGVVQGLEFLRNTALGKEVPVGRTAVVIGGGNVAFDCARTLVRKGVEKVTIMYRRTRQDMPAHEEEILEAEREGVQFMFLAAPERIIKDSQGTATSIVYIKMQQGDPDDSGRPVPVPVEGSETVLDIDTIIPAVGQAADTFDIKGENVPMTRRGNLDADPVTLQTSMKWVFAGGDAVYGAKSVADAVACGKEAAESIDRFINGMDLYTGRENKWTFARPEKLVESAKEDHRHIRRDRVKAETLPPAERAGNFREVCEGYNREPALTEASRCLECGVCSECYECVNVCQPNAIRHDMQPEYLTLTVGSVIIATGFDIMDPKPLKEYGYGKYPNVFTSLEFERLNNATGPTGGQILMKNQEGEFQGQPESVAMIHCAGSRDARYHEYCSRVCCMYALKYAHLIKEKVGHETKVYDFYIDMRCYGKGYEEFYRRCQEEDTLFVRSKPASVVTEKSRPGEVGKLVVIGEDTLLDRAYRIPVDMVILCTAVEPRKDAGRMAQMFGIRQGKDGFFAEIQNKISPMNTSAAGIFLAGTCQSPKDIADTVAQASGAAGQSLELAMRGSVEIPYTIAWIDPESCSGCRTCFNLCNYEAIAFDEVLGVSMVNPAVCKGCGECVSACTSSAAHIWQFKEKRILTEFDHIPEGHRAAEG